MSFLRNSEKCKLPQLSEIVRNSAERAYQELAEVHLQLSLPREEDTITACTLEIFLLLHTLGKEIFIRLRNSVQRQALVTKDRDSRLISTPQEWDKCPDTREHFHSQVTKDPWERSRQGYQACPPQTPP